MNIKTNQKPATGKAASASAENYLSLFLGAVPAGLCIGLGGIVYLRIKDAFPGGSLAGALLFGIGLFTICTHGYLLYTGKACALLDKSPSYLLELFFIWLGNLVGCTITALLASCTALAGGETGLRAAASALVDAKLAAPLFSLFVLGILCNILIFIAVSGYNHVQDPVGKYLALFLGVAVFILSGTEHSIADMFYWAMSGALFTDPISAFLRLFVITIGNLAGGIILPGLEKLMKR